MISYLYNVSAESKKLDMPAQMHRVFDAFAIPSVVTLYRVFYCVWFLTNTNMRAIREDKYLFTCHSK